MLFRGFFSFCWMRWSCLSRCTSWAIFFCLVVDVQSHFTRLLSRPLLSLPFRGLGGLGGGILVCPPNHATSLLSIQQSFAILPFPLCEGGARVGTTRAGLGCRVAVESVTWLTHGTTGISSQAWFGRRAGWGRLLLSGSIVLKWLKDPVRWGGTKRTIFSRQNPTTKRRILMRGLNKMKSYVMCRRSIGWSAHSLIRMSFSVNGWANEQMTHQICQEMSRCLGIFTPVGKTQLVNRYWYSQFWAL